MTQNRLKLGLATPLNIKLRTEREKHYKKHCKLIAGAVHWESQSLWTESLKKRKARHQLESVGGSFCELGIEA